jgi:hypothetical protein
MPSPLVRLVGERPSFRSHGDVAPALERACDENEDLASARVIGQSEEGRPIHGIVLGRGDRAVSLIAGNHPDEPVGPETLRAFVLNGLADREALDGLLERFRFVVVPHTNPDGEARNRRWIDAWPDPLAYAAHVNREPPGRDLEFGFPAMRPENEAVAEFLRDHGPYVLHASLHGMAMGEGASLLINRPWTFRTQALRDGFVEAAREAGLRMHDHNRKGEKGFFWIEPGFQTTPRGDAMRTFFRAQGDPGTAERFHQSSMEFVMGLGGDPLALVTELPLFVVNNPDPEPGRPEKYLALRERLPEIKARLARGADVGDLLEPFDLRPLPLRVGMRLQMRVLELGLDAVDDAA